MMILLKFRKLLAIAVIIICCVASFPAPVWAADMANGTKVFTVQCAGCHVNGGNIVRRGKNLYKKALLRNQMDSIAAISDLVAQGKYAMPAFHDRLTPQQIEDVAAYVLTQAENNWK